MAKKKPHKQNPLRKSVPVTIGGEDGQQFRLRFTKRSQYKIDTQKRALEEGGSIVAMCTIIWAMLENPGEQTPETLFDLLDTENEAEMEALAKAIDEAQAASGFFPHKQAEDNSPPPVGETEGKG